MRAARRIVVVVLLSQVAWAVPAAVALSFVDPVFFLAFGAVALAVVAVLLCFLLHWQRVDARREAVLGTGTRVPALLVASRATGTRVDRRTVRAHTFEARTGGRVVRAEARAFAHLPVGTAATIAFDPAEPARAVVVEDLDALATEGRLDWDALRRRETDRMFRDRP
jgi:hypothetical protein